MEGLAGVLAGWLGWRARGLATLGPASSWLP